MRATTRAVLRHSRTIGLSASLAAAACGPVGGERGPVGGEDDQVAEAQSPIIFGNDDRIEYGAITDPVQLRFANATAALFFASDVSCPGGGCNLAASAYASGQTANGLLPLCAGTRF